MGNLDLGVIGNCTVSALVDTTGRMLWACLPRMDGDPFFCGLLDAGGEQDAGTFTIALQNFVRAEQEYLRTPRWKLIVSAEGDGEPGGELAATASAPRLFDLAFDPAEQLDVSRAVPAEVDTLMAALTQWRELVGPSGLSVPANLDPAIRAQLEALGYLP